MRPLSLTVVSTLVFAVAACAAEPADEAEAGADELRARSVEGLLFDFLPGPTIHFGFSEKKKGNVECVAASIAPPGGPVSTTVTCNADGASRSLRDADAKKVMDFLAVDAAPLHGGGGIGMRKSASVECVKRANGAPTPPITISYSCKVVPASPNACPTSEISFTQASGCENDGSIEFCIPKGDDAILASVKDIASDVRCAAGGGRARCNLRTQLLCSLPTRGARCAEDRGAMTDAAWHDVCRIASLAEVTKIVPTFAE